jgi:hypothetical protein
LETKKVHKFGGRIDIYKIRTSCGLRFTYENDDRWTTLHKHVTCLNCVKEMSKGLDNTIVKNKDQEHNLLERA